VTDKHVFYRLESSLSDRPTQKNRAILQIKRKENTPFKLKLEKAPIRNHDKNTKKRYKNRWLLGGIRLLSNQRLSGILLNVKDINMTHKTSEKDSAWIRRGAKWVSFNFIFGFILLRTHIVNFMNMIVP
jgi:hypothetical protein